MASGLQGVFMSTLLIALASFAGFILAYYTYGRWLSGRVFGVSSEAEVPSHQLRDDVDFIPTKREVIFGHHFTSIAGTGPIVGPAIAVFWGWLPWERKNTSNHASNRPYDRSGHPPPFHFSAHLHQ